MTKLDRVFVAKSVVDIAEQFIFITKTKQRITEKAWIL